MSGLGTILIIIAIALIVAVVLVIVGVRAPEAKDPIQERLAEFSVREEPMSVEEIALSQRFYERILLPFFNRVGKIASRFTPQATLATTRHRLEMAGNPMQMDPAFLLAMRFILAVVFGGLLFAVFAITRRSWVQGLGLSTLVLIIGFMFPDIWLSGRVRSRQRAVFRAMPASLDFVAI